MEQTNHTREKGSKTFRGRKTLTAVLVLVGVLAGVCVWQRENIDAFLKFRQYSQEEIEQKLEENNQVINSATSSVPKVIVRPATDEEKKALEEGTMTKEELIESLQKPEEGKPAVTPEPEEAEKTSQPEKPEAPPPQPEKEEQTPEQSAYEKQVSEIIATVYVMREEYLIELDRLKDAAVAEYKAMGEEERTGKKLAEFVSGYAAKALQMEKECDAKMLDVVERLETLLKENGGDVSLAQKVYDTYVEEKNLKKAWYMAELTKRGLSYS